MPPSQSQIGEVSVRLVQSLSQYCSLVQVIMSIQGVTFARVSCAIYEIMHSLLKSHCELYETMLWEIQLPEGSFRTKSLLRLPTCPVLAQ